MKAHGHYHGIDYYAYQSPAKRLNPVFKLAAVFCILCLCLSGRELLVSLYIAVSMAIVNVRQNRISLREYLRLLCIPLVFILLSGAAIVLEPVFSEQGFYIRVTEEGMVKGAELGFRSLGAVSALYFLILSTPAGELVAALRRCRIPGMLAELMSLVYRYIFILTDTEARMRTAAQSRLGYTDFRTGLRTFGSSIGNLFVISLKKAGDSYDAMTARCYDGELLFWEEKKPVTVLQAMSLLLYSGSILIIRML